jgi:hypothetical protein
MSDGIHHVIYQVTAQFAQEEYEEMTITFVSQYFQSVSEESVSFLRSYLNAYRVAYLIAVWDLSLAIALIAFEALSFILMIYCL